MNRKLLVICLISIIVVLAFACVYIKNSQTNYAKRLDFGNNQVLAVFYIGGTYDTYNYSLAEKFFTLEELKSFKDIEIGGEEKYLIVPRYKGTVEVHSLTLAENEEIKSSLKEIVDKPFYITCNASDIFPNSRVKLTTRLGEFVYTPYICLKDGSVVVTDNVLLVNL